MCASDRPALPRAAGHRRRAPTTMEGSLELARAAPTAGIDTIVATPHVSARYPNDAETIAAAGRGAQRAAGRGGARADGAARCRDRDQPARRDRARPSSHGSASAAGAGCWSSRPSRRSPSALEAPRSGAPAPGCGVVLAHPERCPALQRDRRVLRSLVREGVLTSVTAGSLVGRFGGEVRALSRSSSFGEGLVHNVASDAHDASRPRAGHARRARAGRARRRSPSGSRCWCRRRS